mgnify:CR=1 FL=1
MKDIMKLVFEREAKALGEDIVKAFKQYHVNINIANWQAMSDRMIFEIKLRKNTREVQVRERMSDVQQRLKLPFFQIVKFEFSIFIIAAKHKMTHPALLQILSDPEWREHSKGMSLPYVVGHDEVGTVVTVDVGQFPHLLLAGASNSGKTVGLHSLLTSIIHSKLPSQVNLILIDVGASDLVPFNGIPYLSCPVVSDRQTAYQVLISLLDEMERRIKLQSLDSELYDQLPRLVIVVDEFPALFAGMEDKRTSKVVINAVSGLLQRGRHAKIHVVLAAQNPTIQNMKVDLGNITARIAFKCAKKNFSETIIGAGGAENLSGKGELYFKSPQYEGLIRIQGIFISPEEIQQEVSRIKSRMEAIYHDNGLKFTIDIDDLQYTGLNVLQGSSVSSQERKADNNVQMFIHALLWTLGQRTISCNLLMSKFSIGWKRAKKIMDRLNGLGIVEDLDSKLSRRVLVSFPDDLPEELLEFLSNHGVAFDDLINAFGLDD